jgi:ABC-2 type transport system ATP-binding protein
MIEIKNLTMYYGPTIALDSVSFNVKEREIVGLLGPNGAGKTTLMRILTTFIYPTKGSAKIGGFDITQDPLEVRKLIGYLPEIPPLYMDMRVDEYIHFVGRSRGLSADQLKKRESWVIDATKIDGVWKDMINELSLGFRQRVGLAQALIHDPKVVILDEPTSGLDPMQIVSIRQLIRDLAKDKTVIFSTHILQEASAVADRLVIIDRGKIIANATAAELKSEKTKDTFFYVTLTADREESRVLLAGAASIKEIEVMSASPRLTRFLCRTNSYEEASSAINHLVKQKELLIKELALREPSLEEIFLGLFKTSDKKV